MVILHSEWDKMVQYLKSQHQEYKSFSAFREWDSITRIPLYEVHSYEGYLEYARSTQNSLIGKNKNKWEYAMSHSPQGYSGDNDVFSNHSIPLGNITTNPYNLKNNHHFFKYNSLTKNNILDFDRIVELGGGCGDFAKFVINMGFKGEYTIIDIPEILEIQKHNLSGCKVNFTPLAVPHKPDTLFVSTWGFSECPLSWREEIINTLNPNNWLITYQNQFNEISNENYFRRFSGVREDIPWIPWDGGSKYLLK
jgi:hypothetical protein|tara:strand:- start:59 stop:814 length:756 start_codon:yes stop_codon:yes gene_type:complete